ncbi:hypothetical protein DVH24_016398 [Malus domestica]|uniref:HAT C-terminal dimerisation domain-containing protein n=1 Tax=Malus domestica TaxID=3750 RepID=A0A498HQ43_MALDO|nr:hypothetical protein DVH24_016398 [Malus domestica]
MGSLIWYRIRHSWDLNLRYLTSKRRNHHTVVLSDITVLAKPREGEEWRPPPPSPENTPRAKVQPFPSLETRLVQPLPVPVHWLAGGAKRINFDDLGLLEDWGVKLGELGGFGVEFGGAFEGLGERTELAGSGDGGGGDVDSWWIGGICDLAKEFVKTGRYASYMLVYKLPTLVLVLPITTALVKRAFSAMKIVKTPLRNKMGDQSLNDGMFVYIERDVFAFLFLLINYGRHYYIKGFDCCYSFELCTLLTSPLVPSISDFATV